jgi:hypothetical protein
MFSGTEIGRGRIRKHARCGIRSWLSIIEMLKTCRAWRCRNSSISMARKSAQSTMFAGQRLLSWEVGQD